MIEGLEECLESKVSQNQKMSKAGLSGKPGKKKAAIIILLRDTGIQGQNYPMGYGGLFEKETV